MGTQKEINRVSGNIKCVRVAVNTKVDWQEEIGERKTNRGRESTSKESKMKKDRCPAERLFCLCVCVKGQEGHNRGR